MIKYLFLILASFAIVFVEPFMRFTLGVSILMLVWGVMINREDNSGEILFLIITSLAIDTVLKYPLGTYILSLLTFSSAERLLNHVLREDRLGRMFLKTLISVYFGLLVLGVLSNLGFSTHLLSAIAFPALFTAIAMVIVKNFVVLQGSSNTFKMKK
ncbi:hypothetical protein IT417_02030 [bacterium]|nr:hypothetical protein [bacterium]